MVVALPGVVHPTTITTMAIPVVKQIMGELHPVVTVLVDLPVVTVLVDLPVVLLAEQLAVMKPTWTMISAVLQLTD